MQSSRRSRSSPQWPTVRKQGWRRQAQRVHLERAIALLMAVLTISYRQVIRGYQGGGGSYAVARANLGTVAGLVAASALLVDYVLTVATSISSGVERPVRTPSRPIGGRGISEQD